MISHLNSVLSAEAPAWVLSMSYCIQVAPSPLCAQNARQFGTLHLLQEAPICPQLFSLWGRRSGGAAGASQGTRAVWDRAKPGVICAKAVSEGRVD